MRPLTQTRNATTLAQLDQVTTILSPANVCTSSSPPLHLLVVVCSAVNNYESRQGIRKSWAKDQFILKDVRVVFLLGKLTNNSADSKLKYESDTFGDILQEEFIDSYANLTVKSLMLLKWFQQNCDGEHAKVEYVLKTDDDMYVNLVNLRKTVEGNNSDNNLLVGFSNLKKAPIRDPFSKW